MIVGGTQDLAAMKKLLTSWQVEILYDVFKEEDITINELKIMELKHINNLLQNYKIGVRIRFEHNFNNWRNKIGLPIKYNNCCCRYNAKEYNENSFIGCHNMLNTINNDFNTDTKRKRHRVSVDFTDLNETQPPQSVKSENEMVEMSPSEEILNNSTAALVRTESPIDQIHNTDDEVEMNNLNVLSYLLSSSVNDDPPKFTSKQTPDRCPANLAQILQSSGSRGQSIVEFYKKNKHFTNIHRIQLIQTIVDFFDENNYHLSLNMSYNLEWEILKMFPTEKLENYRTEKRGKLYVKFCNMKRYKRERNNKVNSEIETITRRTHLNNNYDNDQSINRRTHMKNNDNNDESIDEIGIQLEDTEYNWPAITEPEVIVKEEPVAEN